MAKIEAKEVLEAIDKHKQSNHDIPARTPEAKVFSDGYDLALDHIKEIVTIMNIGAEAIAQLEEKQNANSEV